MADKELKDIEQVAQRVADAHGFLHIDDKTAQLTALDAQIAQAGFWDDAQRAQTVSKQASSLRDTIDAYNAAVSLLDDARAAHELAGEDPLFAEFLVSKGFPFTVDNPITELVTFDDVVNVRQLDRDAFLAEYEEYRAARA